MTASWALQGASSRFDVCECTQKWQIAFSLRKSELEKRIEFPRILSQNASSTLRTSLWPALTRRLKTPAAHKKPSPNKAKLVVSAVYNPERGHHGRKSQSCWSLRGKLFSGFFGFPGAFLLWEGRKFADSCAGTFKFIIALGLLMLHFFVRPPLAVETESLGLFRRVGEAKKKISIDFQSCFGVGSNVTEKRFNKSSGSDLVCRETPALT